MATSNLKISFSWKLLVAICVWVAEVRTSVFNALVSRTKVFFSYTKHVRVQSRSVGVQCQNVRLLNEFASNTNCDRLKRQNVRLQNQTGSSQAITAFFCESVRLQCDELVRLPCDVVLGD